MGLKDGPLIWVEGYMAGLSMVREKLLVLYKLDLAPMKRASVLLLFNLRMFKANQILFPRSN